MCFLVLSYCGRKASQIHLLASVFPCMKMEELELARLSKVASNTITETGWDLGRFTAVLPCLHLGNKIQRSCGTKNNKHSWGRFWTKRLKKKKKNPAATSEEPGTKTEYRSKSRVLCLTPALNTTKVWASYLNHQPDLLDTPLSSPHIRNTKRGK